MFQAEEPGDPIELPHPYEVHSVKEDEAAVTTTEKQTEANDDVERAGIRIDLSRIGGN
ncbi:hypothetical protein [Rhizobium leguminosarum]|uniref:hypothetical protein n=1 Tax=Rhizobium leguminosarum TaxID=384 RepID=UPI0004BB39D4|nr:hypothetical protein [Rhizobium leguminosarum]